MASSLLTTTAVPVHTASLGRNQARSLNACHYGTFNLWEGSVRSGKTYVSILAFLLYVARAPRGGQIVIVGKNLGSIYRNFFKAIDESPGLRAFRTMVIYRQNAPTAYIFGREVHVIGANDGRAESKIRGMTVLACYVDEATVLPEEFFKQLQARMSLDDSVMYATTNPDSPAHWLKTDFLDRLRELPDWRRYHFVMEDNPSLSEAVKTRLRGQYTGLWFKRFIQGLWVAAEGAIYDMWDPARHVVPWESLPPMQQLLGVGVDFGTNNPSTGMLLGLSMETVRNRDRARLYFIDEWRYDSRGSTTGTLAPSQQARLFSDWLAQPHFPDGHQALGMQPRFVLVDPAATHFSRELNLIGISTAGGLNKVQYGIATMASLFSEEQLVVSDRCPGFIKEAPGYAWDAKKAKEGIDVPIKVADHSLDGGRYVVNSTEQFWRPALNWPLELALAA